MAAQFEYVPNTTDFQSTAEPLIIQVSESVAGPYFKYRFVLRIKNRNSTTTFATLKTHPLSTTNLSAIFDISRVLDDYIGPNVVNGRQIDPPTPRRGWQGRSPSALG